MKPSINEIELEENEPLSLLAKLRQINFDQLFFQFRYPILVALIGLILVGLGVFFSKNGSNLSGTKVEVLNSSTEGQAQGEIVVEVSGEVEKPGVYKLDSGARIEDALIAAGGVSADADRIWLEKYLNRAAKLTDGQKIYIPASTREESTRGGPSNSQSVDASANNSGGGSGGNVAGTLPDSNLVNINTATLKELDTLPGIGPIYGQSIIDHRPYSTIEELLSKGVLKKSVYEKIKEKVTIY